MKINFYSSPAIFRRVIVLLLLTFTFFLLPFSLTEATIRYVSKTGNSTPPYLTWETSADSIQECINVCIDGDTIIVAAGIYKEALAIYSAITMLGTGIDSVIINGQGINGLVNPGVTVHIFNNVSIENFTIYGKSLDPDICVIQLKNTIDFCNINNCCIKNGNLGILAGGTNCRFTNLFIDSMSYGGIGAGSITPGDSVFYFNNVIRILNNGQYIIGIEGLGFNYILHNILLANGINDWAIYSYWDTETIIKNNIISGFRDRGIDDTGSQNDTTIIHNNLFLYVTPYVNVEYYEGNTVSFKNNVVAYNSTGITNVVGQLKTDYNIFWGNGINGTSNVIMGEHNLYVDPMFVKDVAPHLDSSYDFHLQKYSPAIDAGDPEILDADGTRSDIGLFGGPLGESYTYQDLAPRPPRNLTASYDTIQKQIILKWLSNTEADLDMYILYRDTVSGFIISPEKKVYSGKDTTYIDDLNRVNAYYYKVCAVDSQKNQSAPGEEISVVITDVKENPGIRNNDYILYSNYPNPFNPSTRIGYYIKTRAYVKVMVYNINGERIAVLVNEEQAGGYHEVEFNAEGKGDELIEKQYGKLASGIYMYRIEVTGEGSKPLYSEMKKMILIK